MGSNVSIIGYHLREVQTWLGSDGMGLNCQLWKNDVHLASLSDKADGGEPEIWLITQQEDLQDAILVDYRSILSNLGAVVQVESLAMIYSQTVFGAICGIVNMLTDLDEFRKQNTTMVRKTKGRRDSYFAIGKVGSSLFTSLSNTKSENYFIVSGYPSLTAAENRLRSAVAADEDLGRLLATFVSNGEFDWNLSLEHYVALYTP